MWTTIAEWVVSALIVLGALLCAISSLGLIRMPDVYTRSHAAGKTSTLGVLLILVGVFLYFWWFERAISGKTLLVLVFLFATAPVASHLIGRAAYRSRVPLTSRTVQDDLAKAMERTREERGT